MKVYSDIPYPKIQVSKKSKETANLLSYVYASNESELTQILLYVYQSMVLENVNQEIAQSLLEISKVEMHHLYLLGNTIQALGSSPIYADCNFNMKNYWNSDDVYYDTDLKTILEIDIESEKRAIYDYQMLLNVIDDCYIKNLLERIILDEQIHLQIFLELSKVI